MSLNVSRGDAEVLRERLEHHRRRLVQRAEERQVLCLERGTSSGHTLGP